MSNCNPTPIETLYSTRVTVIPSTVVETTTRNGLLNLGVLGPPTTETITRSTFIASQVLIPTSTVYATPSACGPQSSSNVFHSSSLILTMTDTEHSTTRTTTAPILSPSESAGSNSSLITTDQQSTSTLVTAIETNRRSTVYLTLTATFSNPVTIAVATSTATLVGESPSNLSQEHKKVDTAPIAGGVLGGILALGLLGLFSFCLYRNRRRKRIDRATSDLNTVLAGGNLDEKRSTSTILLGGAGGSRNMSSNRLNNGRFSWDDEMEEVDGVQVQMDGAGMVDPYEGKDSSEGEQNINNDSNPPSLLDNRDWLPTNSNANSVAGYVHGSSAGPHEEEEASTAALSRNPSDPRGLLTSRPSVQKTSSTTTLLSPQSFNHGPLTPASPMSISQGEDPLSHASFIPTSPSSIYRPSSPPIQTNTSISTSPYPSSAPNTLGRAVGRGGSYSNSMNNGSSSLSRAGSAGEMWLMGNNNQMEGEESSRPPRERKPSSPLPVSMPLRTWSQSQSQGYIQQQHPPRSPPVQPQYPNDLSPQKRHYSFNSNSRPTSPFQNHRGGQRQSSYHSSSRPSSPNANGTFTELPPSRYSHLDWPRPNPNPTSPSIENSEGFSQKARASSSGLLPPPEEELRSQMDQLRSNFTTSPPPMIQNQHQSKPPSVNTSNPSSKSNSPLNSRPSSRSQRLSSNIESYHQQMSKDVEKQISEQDSKVKNVDAEEEEDSKDTEMWLDARE